MSRDGEHIASGIRPDCHFLLNKWLHLLDYLLRVDCGDIISELMCVLVGKTSGSHRVVFPANFASARPATALVFAVASMRLVDVCR